MTWTVTGCFLLAAVCLWYLARVLDRNRTDIRISTEWHAENLKRAATTDYSQGRKDKPAGVRADYQRGNRA